MNAKKLALVNLSGAMLIFFGNNCASGQTSTAGNSSQDSWPVAGMQIGGLPLISKIYGKNNLTNSSFSADDILPGAFEVTRGTLIAGTLADLLASDDSNLSIRTNIRSVQSVVQIDLFGNSVNAFPSAIDVNVETAVFARRIVNLEVEAYNFFEQEFELVDVREANLFFDQVETISLAGDLTRFITPNSGSMRVRLRFVSPNNRQHFAANIDHFYWTIFE